MTTYADLAELAESMIHRAVRDVQGQGPGARDAWAWLMLPPDDQGAREGWDLEDACSVLAANPSTIRQRLIARGHAFPPPPSARASGAGGRILIPGVVQCRKCAGPAPTPDVRSTRTCAACGGRLQVFYLRRFGLIPPGAPRPKGLALRGRPSMCPPHARTHAAAALRLLLRATPILPGRYLREQLTKQGLSRTAIRRGRERLGLRILRSNGYTLWSLPAESNASAVRETP